MLREFSSCTQSKAVVSCLFVRSDTWTRISSIELQYWTSGGTWTSVTPNASAYVTINSVRYVQLSYSGLAANTSYILRASYRASSITGYTSSATIHTLANLLEAPEQLNVTRNDAGDEATVTWAAPDGTVTSYLIQRAELQRSSGVAVWGDETYFTTADASFTTHTDTGLDPDKTYQYQVAGVNDNGTGYYSTTVRTIGAAGEVAVTVDERTFDAIPTPDHGQLPTGYDTSTGDAEMVAAVDSSITQILSPTGLTWDDAKMRHFLVVFGSGGLAGLGLIGNNRLGGQAEWSIGAAGVPAVQPGPLARCALAGLSLVLGDVAHAPDGRLGADDIRKEGDGMTWILLQAATPANLIGESFEAFPGGVVAAQLFLVIVSAIISCYYTRKMAFGPALCVGSMVVTSLVPPIFGYGEAFMAAALVIISILFGFLWQRLSASRG